LAWHFIPDSIKIKLECDFETRVKRVAARDKISFEEAREHTEFREKMIAERYRKYYGITDFTDEKFDLVIDTANIDVEAVVGKIEKVVVI